MLSLGAVRAVLIGRPMPRMCALIAEDLSGAERVLQVGADIGLVTVAAARVARLVVATNYSNARIGALRANLESAGIANVECQTRDIYALGFQPHSFDAVVAANVLHQAPDLPGAIAALRAMLRPGGKLLAPTVCDAQTWVSRVLSRLLALTRFPGYRRFTMESLGAALAGAGLSVTRQETIPGPIPIGFVSGTFAPSGGDA